MDIYIDVYVIPVCTHCKHREFFLIYSGKLDEWNNMKKRGWEKRLKNGADVIVCPNCGKVFHLQEKYPHFFMVDSGVSPSSVFGKGDFDDR